MAEKAKENELSIAKTELVFQNEEKEKRAAELLIANTELIFQNEEKEKRAAELVTANGELVFQNKEKEKRADELLLVNRELKKAQEKISKIGRVYAFISQVNQKIVHIEDEETLFRNACNIALEFGKFKMAWVGLFDKAGEKIALVDQCGIPGDKIGLFLDAPILAGGPQEYVLRTKTYYISNDIKNDPRMERWMPLATDQSIFSCMVLPVKKAGKIIGTFNLYAGELNFFDKEEIALLIEVTGDISFALDMFEKGKKQKETDELLVNNEKRFRALIEKSPDMKTLSTARGEMIYCSASITKGLGYSHEEFLQKYPWDIIHPDDIEEYLEKRNKLLQTPGKSFDFQQRRLNINGSWIWCEGTVTNMLHEAAINALVTNFRDITEKKIIEQQREFDKNNLNALINNTADLMWSVDRDFKLITFNQPMQEMVKLSTGTELTKGGAILPAALSNEQLNHFKVAYERAFTGETFTETEHYELPIESWAEISYYPIRNEYEIIGAACHSRDISERKRAEKKLEQNEARLKEAQALSHISNWGVDLLTGHTTWSDELYNIFGIKKGEVQPSPESFLSLLHPEDFNYAREIVKGNFTTFKDSSFYARTIAKDGSIKYLYAQSKFEFDKNNKPIRLYGTLQDITERKLAEEKIKQSEAHLAEAQRLAKMGSWNYDIKSDKLIWSEELYHVFDTNKQTFIETHGSFLELLDAEDREIALQTSRQTQKTGEPFAIEYHITTTKNEKRIIHEHGYGEKDAKGKIIRLFGTAQDITERKLAEEALELTQFAIDNAADAIFWMRADARIINVNAAACNLLGYTRSELLELSVPDIDSDYNAEKWAVQFAHLRQNGSQIFETIQRAKDGRMIAVEIRANYIKFGNLELNCAFTRDISERKKAEENLKQSESRFREIFDSAPQGIVVIDATTLTFVKYNDNALEILKYTGEEILQKGPVDVSPQFQPDGRPSDEKAKELIMNAMNGEKVVFEWLVKDVNGLEIICEIRLVVLSNISGPQVLINFIDITERKKVEKEREKLTTDIVQRNKDLEQFSFIVSHNLRAPVANIIGLTDIALYQETNPKQLKKVMEGLSYSVKKLDEIIIDLNNILKVRSIGDEKKEMIHFSLLANDIYSSIENIIKKEKAVLLWDFSEVDDMLTLKSYLYSIFYNLISNSIKYHQPGIAPVITIKSRKLPGKIEILFIDNGSGIDLEKKGDQVFGLYQRFHEETTEGKGLGLYMVKTQVVALGGKISIESAVNMGTTFKIEFKN